MRVSHSFLIRMEAVYHTLKTAERKAADSILKNPLSILDASITTTAGRSGCSEATLVRLARHLGYSGYPEMKSAVMELEEESPIHSYALYESIDQNDSCRDVSGKIFSAVMQALADTMERMDFGQYENALNGILRADRILFVGAGDAYIAAYSASLKFSRLGYNAVCTKDYDLQLMEASRLKQGDAVVAISHSGKTNTIREVLRCAEISGAYLIAITNYPNSPVAKVADSVLLTATFAKNVQNEMIAKRIPELGIIETLYVNTLLRSEKKRLNMLDYTNRAVKANKLGG